MMRIANKLAVSAAVLSAAVVAGAQQPVDPGFRSVGRGAPLAVDLSQPPANPVPVKVASDDPAVQQAADRDPWQVGPFPLRGGFGGPPLGVGGAGGPAGPGRGAGPGPGGGAAGGPGAPPAAAPGAPRAAGPAPAPGVPPAPGAAAGRAPPVVVASAIGGAVPPGIQPLPVDLFTTRDFYKDRQYWSDKRYFRCNSPYAAESQRGANGAALAGDDPAKAPWGFCDRDYPREAMVSPYGFKTAQAHYEALLAETKARGGPTQHTYATVPGEWTGRYGLGGQNWYGSMRVNQISTVLSLLTPEYQKRMVQNLYQEGVQAASQWPSQYCWPEGFMRRFDPVATQPGINPHYVLVTPEVVQISTGVARNFITNIHVGRTFNMTGAVPRLGADVPRWYGETIGFWDKDVLITWTSNVQGWTVHGKFEFSNKMQTVEIYAPMRDAQGRLTGLNHEAIFYDPEALVEPIRIVRTLTRMGGMDTGNPYTFIECVPNIMPVKGHATPVSPGTVVEYEVPDIYGRPWAKNWERYFEEGMSDPDKATDEELFDFSGN